MRKVQRIYSEDGQMTPAELTAWRSRMGWTAKKASQELGLSEKGYAAYERGFIFEPRRPDKIGRVPSRLIERPIPRHVELACERLEELAAAKLSPSL